jgi:hypothetical protein
MLRLRDFLESFSRSVTMPIGRPFSTTGIEPMSASRILRAISKIGGVGADVAHVGRHDLLDIHYPLSSSADFAANVVQAACHTWRV